MHGFGVLSVKFLALEFNDFIMIKYTPAAQLTLEGFKHPFVNQLDKNNRWVKLAALLPWDALAAVYASKLDLNRGRQCVDVRMVLGSLIVKHKLKLSDRETVDMISENIYLQYFCGLPAFQTKAPFDPSILVDIRDRIGHSEFDSFNLIVIGHAEKMLSGKKAVDSSSKKDDDEHKDQVEISKNKGTLKVDATIADQQISFPTDLKLLATAREESERLIDILFAKTDLETKPRTYRREARKAYLNITKHRKKSKQLIHKGNGQQLRYLNRNITTINHLLDLFEGLNFPLSHTDLRLFWILQTIFNQQDQKHRNAHFRIKHRIVSIYQPHVRPMVRGKDKTNVEFGSKLNACEFDGWCRINKLEWEAYNEAGDLINQIEQYKDQFGYYPKTLLADQIYLNRENRAYLKEHEIYSPCKALGRPPKVPKTAYQRRKTREQRAQRNLIEGKFGQGKNGYGLNLIKARKQNTSESWIAAIFFVMNLVTFMKKAEKLFLWSLFCQKLTLTNRLVAQYAIKIIYQVKVEIRNGEKLLLNAPSLIRLAA